MVVPMNMTPNQQIQEEIDRYSEELDLIGKMSITELIDSHRHLRELNKVRHEDWLAQVHEAKAWAAEQARQHALEYNYISRETLRGMTLLQLCEILEECPL